MTDIHKILKALQDDLANNGIGSQIMSQWSPGAGDHSTGVERIDIDQKVSIYYNNGDSAYDDVVESVHPSIVINDGKIVFGVWASEAGVSKILHTCDLAQPDSIQLTIYAVLGLLREIPPPS